MAEFSSVDDFLNYRSSEGGGGGKRLKSWAKSRGYLNWWLVIGCLPARAWYHNLPEVVIRTNRETQQTMTNVWGRQHVCHEDEAILKSQYFRHDDGSRKKSPESCAICRLQEAVREMILDGSIQDTDILFRYDGSDKPEENKVVHAGGLCAIWKRDPDEQTKARLQKHGIYFGNVPGRPGAWAESFVAKISYVLVGVDQDNVEAGVQVAVQTDLVGQKVRELIRDQIAGARTPEDGNPFLKPYCIQLFFDAAAKDFKSKYGARRMDRFAITPEIERLIREPAPSIAKYTTPFDPQLVRASLEAHATPIGKKLPWDAIWKVPVPRARLAPSEKSEEKPPSGSEGTRGGGVDSLLNAGKRNAAPAEDFGDPCDDCGAAMLKTDTKCGKCGATYEDSPVPAPAPSAARDFGVNDDAVYDDGDIPF